MLALQKNKVNLILAIGVSLPLLIISLAVTYYFIIYIPGKEQTKLKIQQQNKILLDKCIKDADGALNYSWGMACFEIQNKLGQKEDPNCSLPSSTAQAIKKTRSEQVDLCLKLYPID